MTNYEVIYIVNAHEALASHKNDKSQSGILTFIVIYTKVSLVFDINDRILLNICSGKFFPDLFSEHRSAVIGAEWN